MDSIIGDSTNRRRIWPRLGITALNLLTPGLGLIRLNEWRAGLLSLFAPFILMAVFVFGQGNFPVFGYHSAVFALVLTVGLLAALYAVPMTVTWQEQVSITSK